MARILARGKISIVDVSDGYYLSLTSPSVSIPIKADDLLPDFSNAKTNIILYKGEVKQKILVKNIVYSDPAIKTKTSKTDDYEYCMELLEIPKDAKSGYITFTVQAEDKFEVDGKFMFTVIPQALDIEWIRDWNGTYTKIGENYVVSPRIFAGDKDSEGKLTGVYLGRLKGFIGQTLPYTFEAPEAGIYGYNHDQLVFYINNLGAEIAGWEITQDSIKSTSQNGSISIKSTGAITGSNKNGKASWALNSDGSASFANGKVIMDNAGNAKFDGEIIAKKGIIGGWLIDSNMIKSDDGALILDPLGSIRASSGSATAWELRNDGYASFANGKVEFFPDNRAYFEGEIKADSGSIGKWAIRENGICNGEICMSSAQKAFVVCASAPSPGVTYMEQMRNVGGVAMFYETESKFGIQVYDRSLKLVASLGSMNMIGSWRFCNDSLYRGGTTPVNTTGSFTNAVSAITIGSRGIRGYSWRLETDGSGSIAKNNIQWDKDGNISFAPSVTMKWETKEDMNLGTMLFRDPSFSNIKLSVTNSVGVEVANGIKVYNNNDNRTVTLRILTDTSSPNSLHRCLWIQTRYQFSDIKPTPGYGGFAFEYRPEPNDVLVARIIAKIPLGYKLNLASNNLGSGETSEWITQNIGTGDWAEYLLRITCQKSGSPSSTCFFYLNDVDPNHPVKPVPTTPSTGGGSSAAFTLEWRVAYATVFSMYTADRSTTTITKDGIYTGTLSADQIKTGKLTAERLNADNLHARNCSFEFGSFTGVMKRQKMNIDPYNYKNFSNVIHEDWGDEYYLDFSKIGSYVVFSGTFSNGLPTLYLPGHRGDVQKGNIISADAFDYVNSVIIFENRSNTNFPISGTTMTPSGTFSSFSIYSGRIAVCTCKVVKNTYGGHGGFNVGWVVELFNIENP